MLSKLNEIRKNLFTRNKTQDALVKTQYTTDELYEKYNRFYELIVERADNLEKYEEILLLRKRIEQNETNEKYDEKRRDVNKRILLSRLYYLDPLNEIYKKCEEENEMRKLLDTLSEEDKKKLNEKIHTEEETEVTREINHYKERQKDFDSMGFATTTNAGGSKKKRNKRRKSRKKIIKKLKKSKSIKKR